MRSKKKLIKSGQFIVFAAFICLLAFTILFTTYASKDGSGIKNTSASYTYPEGD